MVEWLALGEGGNYHGEQRRGQKIVEKLEEYPERPSPDLPCYSFEEFAYCEFGYPDANRIETIRYTLGYGFGGETHKIA